MQKIHINDTVKILTGKDRGKVGKVTQVIPVEELVVVEGANKRYKHLKKQKDQQKGQRVEYFAPLHQSDVAVQCKNCNAFTRVGFKMEGPDKKRICKKCNTPLS